MQNTGQKSDGLDFYPNISSKKLEKPNQLQMNVGWQPN